MCCHVHQLQMRFFNSSRDWCNTAVSMKLLGSSTGPLGLCKPPWHSQRGILCLDFSLRTKTTTPGIKESVRSYWVWKIAVKHFTFPQNIKGSLKGLLWNPSEHTCTRQKSIPRANVGNTTAHTAPITSKNSNTVNCQFKMKLKQGFNTGLLILLGQNSG